MKQFYSYLSNEIHWGSWLLFLGIDLAWMAFEPLIGLPLVGLLICPLLMGSAFVAAFGGVTLVQRFAAGDAWSPALGKGLAVGLLAALPLSFASLILGAFGLFLRLIYRNDREALLLGQFVRQWRSIERRLRTSVPQELRDGKLNEILAYLARSGRLTPQEFAELDRLREIRNTIYHQGTPTDLEEAVRRVDEAAAWVQRRSLR
jgi:hypothetical protein